MLKEALDWVKMAEISTESLAEQTRDYILDHLRKGRWSAGLPAERKLSESLGVSRPVLRDALHFLEKQGYLHRKKRLRVPSSTLFRAQQHRAAVIVHSSVESSMPASTVQLLSIVKDQLRERHIRVSSVTCSSLKTREVEEELVNLQNEFPNEVWILRSPSDATLEWCAQNHPECVVLGAQPDPAFFAGVDLDINAVFAHSLKLCIEKNKKEVVFITPPGKSHAQDKLAQFLAGYSVAGMAVSIEHLPNRDPKEAKRKVLNLLSARPSPNAYICVNFQQWLMVYSVLVEARVSPLKDVFLLCHYADPLMEHVSHGVAHYSFDWVSAAQYLVDRVAQFSVNDTADVLVLSPHFENA